jgi:hypothetical protein
VQGVFEETRGLVDATQRADGRVLGVERCDGLRKRGFDGGFDAPVTFALAERDDLFARACLGHGGERETAMVEVFAEELLDKSGVRDGRC